MRGRRGTTMMELLVVLIMIAVGAVCLFPNFIGPTEKSYATTAQSNLLDMYTAQKNYYNENFNFCVNGKGGGSCHGKGTGGAGCNGNSAICGTLASINANLNLNIIDNGTYTYSCANDNTGFGCSATRSIGGSNLILTVLNQPIDLTGNSPTGANPTCTAASNIRYLCP